MRLNSDGLTAIALLLLCGGFWGATYLVPDMGFQTLGAVVWPRIVLAALTVMSLAYLFGALRPGYVADAAPDDAAGHGPGVYGWFRHHRNPLLAFALYFLFLATMPYLGMLLGGILFVFLTLTVIGDRSPRALAMHGLVAVAMIGAMWGVFTFALRVMLPPGEILPGF